MFNFLAPQLGAAQNPRKNGCLVLLGGELPPHFTSISIYGSIEINVPFFSRSERRGGGGLKVETRSHVK